jgi:4-hydroxy-tetrahydrodipicolinate reductase
MNVLIVGYGRMGRLIEEILTSRGHRVIRRVDSAGIADVREVDEAAMADADGVVEFALAAGFLERVKLYAAAKIPTVVGTTGCGDLVSEARVIVNDAGGTMLQGSNFSVGAHLFFRLTAAAAQLVDSAEEYDTSLIEYHHTGKADHPSGTALTAAKGILSVLSRKKKIVTDLPDGPLPADALQVASVRVGKVPGIHEMRLDSEADGLIIRHEARSRGGFALGAVRGLEWLASKGEKGFFTADEFIDDLLRGGE